MGAVAATTVGGTFFASTFGASTVTCARPRASSHASVSARASSSYHERWRNSTSIRSPRSSSLRPLEVVERRRLANDVRRELEEDPAELPALAQRLERVEELAEDDRPLLARRPVDAPALVDRHALAEVGRHLLELHRVARHEAERLHVHDESVRRPVGPALDHLAVGDAVEGRVDLDRREPLGVVAKALARREPGGYQCVESASSAHEHVPILTVADIASRIERGPRRGALSIGRAREPASDLRPPADEAVAADDAEMHGTGANVAVHPVAPRSRAASVVLDWNHCGDFTIGPSS